MSGSVHDNCQRVIKLVRKISSNIIRPSFWKPEKSSTYNPVLFVQCHSINYYSITILHSHIHTSAQIPRLFPARQDLDRRTHRALPLRLALATRRKVWLASQLGSGRRTPTRPLSTGRRRTRQWWAAWMDPCRCHRHQRHELQCWSQPPVQSPPWVFWGAPRCFASQAIWSQRRWRSRCRPGSRATSPDSQ